MGVLTIVLVRKTLRPSISRVETSEKGIGLLGFGVSLLVLVQRADGAMLTCRATKLWVAVESFTENFTNEQGVAVRIKVHDHTLTFVNSRESPLRSLCSNVESPDLAAFATALERRRQDCSTLLRTLAFPRPTPQDTPAAFEEFLPEQKEKVLSVDEGNALVSYR